MRFLAPALVAVFLAGCGGGVDGQPATPTTPAPAPPPEIEPGSLIAPPAEAGKIAEQPIELGGFPPDTAYEWTPDDHSGWVFPAEGTTDRAGNITDTWWVPGFPGEGRLILTLSEPGGEDRVIEYRTLSEAPANPPWTQVVVRANNLLPTGVSASGFSVDMTPLADPPGTYYAALSWEGGYAGLQRGGTSYNDQLQFSLWDTFGGGQPELVEAANGLHCERFTHEGTGLQCQAEYPWSVGTTYRFEVTEEVERGRSLFSLRVTDLSAGRESFMGTLRAGRDVSLQWLDTFVEDFRRDQPTCLHQPVRSAAFRRMQSRAFEGDEWVPKEWVRVTPGEDMGNPETPGCANYDIRPHPDGLEIITGGTTMGNPRSTPLVRIPLGDDP